MKQGKIYNKLILALLLGAVASYMGFAVFRVLRAPLRTVQAIAYEAATGCRAAGCVVRDETVLTSSYGITVPTRREGERVGVGQTVATGYRNADARARRGELEAAEETLAQLRYAAAYAFDPSETAALDEELAGLFTDCARYTRQRDMAALDAAAPKLKGLLLRSGAGEEDLAALNARIGELEGEVASLRTVSGAESGAVTAPASGCFSGAADGYETVLTPESLSTMTAASLASLQPAALPDGAFGRLILSPDWYFACAVPSELLGETEKGDTVTAGFSLGDSGALPMTVERIGEDEGGKRLLVLSCGDYIQDVTRLRSQTVELVFESYPGLRVPKDALRMDEQGRPGVYVLEGAMSHWKTVSILYDNGESYVVALDKSDTNNLWPGDEIIVNARNLYDGKVVVAS